jgi:hypothetical protein
MNALATSPLPFLSDAEISAMCDGLVAPAAQLRYLQRLGLLVQRKPNGRPLLMRSEVERVLGASRFQVQTSNSSPTGQPNRAGLLQLVQHRRGGKRGTKAQGS